MTCKIDLMENLLGAAGHILERAVADKPHEDERVRDGIALLKRCIWSASTALRLVKSPTTVPQFEQHPFIDFQTIGQICRTIFETTLSFHYAVYSPGVDSDEATYRHAAWRLSGYLARWDAISDPHLHPERWAQEQGVMQDLRDRMSSTKYFKTLTGKQQKEALKCAHWRGPGGNLPWHTMATAAGFGEEFSRAGYRFQSQMVHSTSLAAFQIIEMDMAAQQSSADAFIVRILMCLALMVTWFTDFYPGSRLILELNVLATPVQEFFAELAKKTR